MTRWISTDALPGALPGLLRPGMSVYVVGSVNEPLALIEALAAAPAASAGVTYIAQLVPGINRGDLSALHPEARLATFFATPEIGPALAAGRVDFLPIQYRLIYDYLRDHAKIDLVLAQLAPPDGDGNCSQGLSVDFLPAVIDKAGIVVAEINRAMPAPPGAPTVPLARVDYAVETDRPVPTMPAIAPTVPLARVDYAVETDRPLPVMPVMAPSAAARAIGRLIADLVHDGDCIETGIGAIPSAVLAALGDKNDLGLHSGMIADGVMELAEAGVLTGAAKPIDRGKIVTGLTLGSAALYAWAGRARQVRYRAVDYTHDVGQIRQIDNFVAINSALEVDLFGQINADMLAGRQVSGTGGSVDFMRGAARARNGRSIVALTATAARGSVSRIVPALAAGTAATALRTDVDYVITEFGAARLRHLPVAARAEALIAIAAPAFRDELRERWRSLSRAPS